jgi:hypothetical protein
VYALACEQSFLFPQQAQAQMLKLAQQQAERLFSYAGLYTETNAEVT